jgi:molecular chaperone DnaK (HSP70)
MIESTAAAMAYGLLVAGTKKVMVFDMGGGTTDISILNIRDGQHDIIYTGGHSQLGGQDFDQHLLSIIQDKLIFGMCKFLYSFMHKFIFSMHG